MKKILKTMVLCTLLMTGLAACSQNEDGLNQQMQEQPVYSESSHLADVIDYEEAYSEVFHDFNLVYANKAEYLKDIPDSEVIHNIDLELKTYMMGSFYYSVDKFKDLVYTFHDIDNSGTKEMLVALKQDSNLELLGIFSQEEGNAVLIQGSTYKFGPNEEQRLVVFKDGLFALITVRNDSGRGNISPAKLSEKSGTSYVLKDGVVFNPNEENPIELLGYNDSDIIDLSGFEWKSFDFK